MYKSISNQKGKNMSNYNSLKTTIDANIKQNGNQEITGQILNSVLNEMVNTLGAGYQFAGVATPATNPGSPDAKVFYIANGKGTYNNFGGIVINEGEVCALAWNGTWTKQVTGAATSASVKSLHNVITETTSIAWNEKPIDTIPKETTIVSVETFPSASVFLRLNASGSQGQQEIKSGTITTFDAMWLVTSVPCSVTIKYGYIDEQIRDVQQDLSGITNEITTINSKVVPMQNALISEWCTNNPYGNSAIRDIYIKDDNFADTDVYIISTLKKDSSSAQITILKNADIVCHFWTNNLASLQLITEIPEYNNSGISAIAIVAWDNMSEHPGGQISNSKINNPFSIIPYLHLKETIVPRWSGKKMLAIGDSVTVGGQWAKEVGRILEMNSVSIHAKAGIGIITMVDGDSTLPALTSADVADKDLICVMGFYNERDKAVDAPGENGDMYPYQNTFIGRLNYAIDKIYQRLSDAGNRNCIVCIISAHKFGKYQWSNRSAYSIVTSGGVQMQDGEALFSATKKAADYNSLPLIDLMHNSCINKYNWDYFQNASTPYNASYIPADGINDGTNKPFDSLASAPNATLNDGKYITIQGVSNCYRSNGTAWVADDTPYIWNADQLHPNTAGYMRIGSHIAQELLTI